MPQRQGISLSFDAALERGNGPIALDISDFIDLQTSLAQDFNSILSQKPDLGLFDEKKWTSSRWKDGKVYSKPPVEDWSDLEDKVKAIREHGRLFDLHIICDGKILSQNMAFENDQEAIMQDFRDNKSRATLYKDDNSVISFPRLSMTKEGELSVNVYVWEKGANALQKINITPEREGGKEEPIQNVSSAGYQDQYSQICNDR